MDCQDLARGELAQEYLQGRLDQAKQDDFEAHILECEKCLDAVEALQTVREDLSVRAHEIRTYPVTGGRLRWSWMAVAATIVVVSGISSIGVRTFTRQAPPSQVAHEDAKKEVAVPDSQQVDGSAPAGTSYSARVGDSPSHGSNLGASRGPKAPSQPIRQVASATHAPHALDKLSTPGNLGQTHSTPQVASAINNQNKSPNSPNGGAAIETHPEGTTAVASVPGQTSPLTQNPPVQVSSEIAQLAQVRPLPYTFSGIAGSQPSSGGSTRPHSALNPGLSGHDKTTPKAGTSGFSSAQDYFRDAMSAYVDGDYSKAGDLLGQAVKLDPEFSEANLYLGICLLVQGKTPDAMAPLQSASRDKKPVIAQPAHYYLAKADLQLGKLIDAENELHAAAAISGRLTSASNALIQQIQSFRNTTDNK